MYGYRTKHKILESYLKRALKDRPKDKPLNLDHYVKMREFSKELGGQRDNIVAQYILNLNLDGYLELKDIPDEKDMKVTITTKGINAAMGEFFKIKQHDFFWKAFMNIVITIANVAVAIVAIIALTKDNSELQKIEDRVKKLEEAKGTISAEANPNTVGLQNSGQTKSKDSATAK